MTAHEEFEGPSLDAVLRQAADRFRLTPEQLRYEVLREQHGFLGVGVTAVAVRVEVPDAMRARSSGRAARRVESPGRRPAVNPVAMVERTLEGEERTAADDAGAESEAQGPEPTAPQVAELAAELVRTAGLRLSTAMSEAEDRIVIELAGEDRELLLERRGETLNALQYLLNRMARKRLGTVKRIQLESEGFRSDRDEEIRTMALEAAARVQRTGSEVRLPPLNPYERRIVHVTIGRGAGVVTESEGDGFIKRISVRPAGSALGDGRARGGGMRRRPRR